MAYLCALQGSLAQDSYQRSGLENWQHIGSAAAAWLKKSVKLTRAKRDKRMTFVFTIPSCDHEDCLRLGPVSEKIK